MYIPNKPDRYGVKLVLLNDSKSNYLVTGIPYLGKQAGNVNRGSLQLGHYFVKELIKKYHHKGRNITTDNWFSSVPLVIDMLNNCGLTYVGNLRANKSEIPPIMKEKTSRPRNKCFLAYQGHDHGV